MPRKRKEPRPAAALPSKDEILDFVRGANGKVGKREIARAFRVKGGDRPALKKMLAEMTEAGLISGNRKTFKERGQLKRLGREVFIFGCGRVFQLRRCLSADIHPYPTQKPDKFRRHPLT